jgi:hypothetical protein
MKKSFNFLDILNLIFFFKFVFFKLFFIDNIEKLNININIFSKKFVSGNLNLILNKSLNKRGIYNVARYYYFLEKIILLKKFDFIFVKKPSFIGKKRKYRLKSKFVKIKFFLKNNFFYFFFSYLFFVLFPRLNKKQLSYFINKKECLNLNCYFNHLGSLDLYNILGNIFDYWDWDLNIFFKFNTISFFNLKNLKFFIENNFINFLNFNNYKILNKNPYFLIINLFLKKINNFIYDLFFLININSRMQIFKILKIKTIY